MTTGLFNTRANHPQGHGARMHQRKLRNRVGTMNQFADLLAEHDLETGDEGGDVKACAARMGTSYAYANAMLQRIRKKLGSQAA